MELAVIIIIYSILVLSYGFNLWLSIRNYKNKDAEVPKVVQDVYDPEKYKKWHEYYVVNFKFELIVNTINTLVFILLLATGFFPLMDKVSSNLASEFELQVVIFLGLYFAVDFVIGIFTSYYQTFKVEEKFGFNKSTKSTFVKDKIKGLLVTIILGGSFLYGLTTLYTHAGQMFFVYTFLFVLVILFISNILYVKVFVPLFNKLKPLEDGTLKTKIETFAQSVGYEVSKISVIDASKRSSKLNAYFSGFGKFKHIVLYDTLVEKCSEEEVVAVLAHEIGHNKYKHMWKGMLELSIHIAIYIAVLILVSSLPVFSEAFGFSGTNFGFVIVLFSVLITPINIPLSLLGNSISRKHEYQADRYAATNYNKKDIESSLKVLTRENFNNLTPDPLYVKMYYSHPPTADRIKAIRKVG